MTDSQLETRTAQIHRSPDDILMVEIKEGSELTLNNAKENIKALQNLSPESGCRVLVNISQVKSVSRECRAFASSQDTHNFITRLALIVNSPVSRVIGNFFLGLNRPPFPLKLFTNKDEAINWLKIRRITQ